MCTHHLISNLTSLSSSDVALVIIITLVAKIYFPESLERRNEDHPVSRSYSYRMVGETNRKETQENMSSDSLSDDEDSEENLNSEDEQDELKQPPVASFQRQFLEFDQETMPKAEVVKRLAFCCLMLNVTFVTWGILQVSRLPFLDVALHHKHERKISCARGNLVVADS